MDEKIDTEQEFGAAFRARIKELRQSRRFTQKDVADFLHIDVEAYKKYENRPGSMLPQHLMRPFCRLIGCEIADLFEKPFFPRSPSSPKTRVRARKH